MDLASVGGRPDDFFQPAAIFWPTAWWRLNEHAPIANVTTITLRRFSSREAAQKTILLDSAPPHVVLEKVSLSLKAPGKVEVSEHLAAAARVFVDFMHYTMVICLISCRTHNFTNPVHVCV